MRKNLLCAPITTRQETAHLPRLWALKCIVDASIAKPQLWTLFIVISERRSGLTAAELGAAMRGRGRIASLILERNASK